MLNRLFDHVPPYFAIGVVTAILCEIASRWSVALAGFIMGVGVSAIIVFTFVEFEGPDDGGDDGDDGGDGDPEPGPDGGRRNDEVFSYWEGQMSDVPPLTFPSGTTATFTTNITVDHGDSRHE